MHNFQRITMNLVPAKKRYETLDGRQWLVVPAVMLTVGVHNGSEGPLFYSAEEMGKNPVVWNHKPVVVYHPTLNGLGISACDPVVVESQRVGMLFNTGFDSKLKTEVWLDEEKTKKVDNRILDAINTGQMMEVSTGLFHDPDPRPGEWNGKKYTAVVRNIQPDHLAILPDQTGACSVADGAGLLRNAEELSYDDIKEQLRALLKTGQYGYVYIVDLFPKYVIYEQDSLTGDTPSTLGKVGYKIRSGKVALDGDTETVRRVVSYVTANGERKNPTKRLYVTMSGAIIGNDETSLIEPETLATSDMARRGLLSQSLAEKYPGTKSDDWTGWISEVRPDHTIWHKDGKYFRLPYSMNDGKIVLAGEPEEVEKTTEYKAKPTTNGVTSVPTPTNNATVESVMGATSPPNTKATVDKLIASGKWTEADRAKLEALAAELLAPAPTPQQILAPAPAPAAAPTVPVQAPVQPTMLNAQDYVLSLPEPIRSLMTNALALQEEERVKLVKTITSNKANQFNEQFLMTKQVPELRAIAALAGTPVPSYAGQADVPMFLPGLQGQQTVQNRFQPVAPLPDAEILQIPMMNFGKDQN
jgi:hypothetical protein